MANLLIVLTEQDVRRARSIVVTTMRPNTGRDTYVEAGTETRLEFDGSLSVWRHDGADLRRVTVYAAGTWRVGLDDLPPELRR